MTRIKGHVKKVNMKGLGTLRVPMMRTAVVGDWIVPTEIEVELPGGDGQPALDMFIEVIDGVPRCTELQLKRTEGGREIRPMDLRAIELEEFIETFVALTSSQIEEVKDGVVKSVIRGDEESVRGAMRTVRDSRKGSRRPMTENRKARVAEIYNSHETGGIEAVERAFSVSRSTAIRYINSARDAGLIEKRTT